jgi:hypothetical protein
LFKLVIAFAVLLLPAWSDSAVSFASTSSTVTWITPTFGGDVDSGELQIEVQANIPAGARVTAWCFSLNSAPFSETMPVRPSTWNTTGIQWSNALYQVEDLIDGCYYPNNNNSLLTAKIMIYPYMLNDGRHELSAFVVDNVSRSPSSIATTSFDLTLPRPVLTIEQSSFLQNGREFALDIQATTQDDSAPDGNYEQYIRSLCIGSEWKWWRLGDLATSTTFDYQLNDLNRYDWKQGEKNPRSSPWDFSNPGGRLIQAYDFPTLRFFPQGEQALCFDYGGYDPTGFRQGQIVLKNYFLYTGGENFFVYAISNRGYLSNRVDIDVTPLFIRETESYIAGVNTGKVRKTRVFRLGDSFSSIVSPVDCDYRVIRNNRTLKYGEYIANGNDYLLRYRPSSKGTYVIKNYCAGWWGYGFSFSEHRVRIR